MPQLHLHDSKAWPQSLLMIHKVHFNDSPTKCQMVIVYENSIDMIVNRLVKSTKVQDKCLVSYSVYF